MKTDMIRIVVLNVKSKIAHLSSLSSLATSFAIPINSGNPPEG